MTIDSIKLIESTNLRVISKPMTIDSIKLIESTNLRVISEPSAPPVVLRVTGTPSAPADLSPIITAGQSIKAGQPVRVANDGTLALAQADAYANVRGIAGMAKDDTAATFPCQIATSFLTLADWSPVTGIASLTPGATYYLDPSASGRLTTTLPSGAGLFIVAFASAVSASTLSLLPFSIIQL